MHDTEKGPSRAGTGEPAGQDGHPVETTTRGSSSQQGGETAGRETTTRGSSGRQSLHTGRGSSESATSLREHERHPPRGGAVSRRTQSNRRGTRRGPARIADMARDHPPAAGRRPTDEAR